MPPRAISRTMRYLEAKMAPGSYGSSAIVETSVRRVACEHDLLAPPRGGRRRRSARCAKCARSGTADRGGREKSASTRTAACDIGPTAGSPSHLMYSILALLMLALATALHVAAFFAARCGVQRARGKSGAPPSAGFRAARALAGVVGWYLAASVVLTITAAT